MAVLGELPGVMADYMGQGKSVRLDGLGTFRYTLATRGVTDEADFDFQQQVKAVRVQFVPAREGAPPSRTPKAPAPARPPNRAARTRAATAASDKCNGR